MYDCDFSLNIIDDIVSDSIVLIVVWISLKFFWLFDIFYDLFQQIFGKVDEILEDEFIVFDIFEDPGDLFEVIYY